MSDRSLLQGVLGVPVRTAERPIMTRSAVLQRRPIRFAAAFLAALLVVVGATFAAAPIASAGPARVMAGYVPLPADDFQRYLESVNSAADTTVSFTVGITNAAGGSQMTYDHHEDGYEVDPANPTQATTLVFGDGDTGNGNAGTYCSACSGDLLPQGAALIMRSSIPTPRTSTVFFDGSDKVSSTRGFTITAGGFTTPLNSVLSGVVSAYDTTKYGTRFTVPVGEDTPLTVGAPDPFSYTGASVMASTDGTTVRVDTDGDGAIDRTELVDEGQSVLIDGGLDEGATIRTSAPVQVHLLTGQKGSAYEARSYTLFSDEVLANDYMSPASSSRTSTTVRTVNYVFNPGAAAISVTPTCTGCSGTLTVPAGSSVKYVSPVGQGVRFNSNEGTFVALAAIGAESSDGRYYDWGYTLIPTTQLTTQVVLGWAPGNSSVPTSTSGSEEAYGPVWVTSVSATTVHVDYDGDPTTGAIASPDCFGARHDADISVGALASTKVWDANDGDMTGARVYTCDGTKLAGAWGQDQSITSLGAPGFDAGYTIIPTTTMLVEKSSRLANDVDADGKFGPGDEMTYRIEIADAGSLAFTDVAVEDVLPDGLDYVPGSTRLVDGATVTEFADDMAPPAATAFPLDEGGLSLPNIDAGATVELQFEARIATPDAPGAGTIGNTVCVTAAEESACDTNFTPLATADVSLTKTETLAPTHAGETASFTVKVENDGPDVAPGVEVTDGLPEGISLVAATSSQGTYDAETGIWTVGDLADGGSATLVMETTVTTSEPVTNTAQVSGGSSVDPDSVPGSLAVGSPPLEDDEGAVTLDLEPAQVDLSLAKSSSPSAVHQGEEATFTLEVTNHGPVDATGVAVTDMLPTGVTWLSDDGAYDPATGIWDVGTVPAGATLELNILVLVDSGDDVTNVAEITSVDQSDPDSSPGNDIDGEDDLDSTVLSSEPVIDLQVDKTVGSAAVARGGSATYSVRVANDGPADATGVDVTDLLPPGVSFSSSVAGQGSYDPTTGVWSVGSLAAGEEATLSIEVIVTGTGVVTNHAELTGADQVDVDSTPANSEPGEDDEDSAALTVLTSAISGSLWHDADRSGQREAGEPSLSGVTVLLLHDDVEVARSITDELGSYRFSELEPGGYVVAVDTATVPVELTDQTVDPDETADGRYSVLVVAGDEADGIDFAYASPVPPPDPDLPAPTEPAEPAGPPTTHSPEEATAAPTTQPGVAAAQAAPGAASQPESLAFTGAGRSGLLGAATLLIGAGALLVASSVVRRRQLRGG